MVFSETKKIFGTIILMIISASAFCQTASVVFESNDAIQITINNILQQNNYSKSTIVYKLTGERPYNVKIEFKNDTSFIQKNIYLIDEGLAHIYTITKEAIQLKKVVPSVSYTKPENQLAIAYLENLSFIMDTINTDTLIAKDSAYAVPFTSYYKLEDYNGRIGCPFPLKDEEKAELRGLIITEKLEESKLEKVKTAIQDMDSACVLIDQIKELTLLLEYEETRIDFIRFIAPNTFDIDNYERLYPLFNFENNKDEVKLLFKKED
tara:strand:- start:307 stop:1101 length:795 start_codon:yes stop_codon:yes gene_type:complete